MKPKANTSVFFMNAAYPVQKGNQKGVALIMVLSVLFALTVLGLASSDSSNLQALMVRNNQFRLEAFNHSFNEIEQQLGFYVTDAGKQPLFAAIDFGTQQASSYYSDSQGGAIDPTGGNDSGGLVESGSNGFAVQSTSTTFNTDISLSSSGGCPIYLNSLGGFKKCSLMELNSKVDYRNTNIGSEQVQQFSFTSF